MIYIKDKQNRTQVYIPRNGEVRADFVLETDFTQAVEELQDGIDESREYSLVLYNQIWKYLDYGETPLASREFVEEYVNNAIGDINNVLENLLS